MEFLPYTLYLVIPLFLFKFTIYLKSSCGNSRAKYPQGLAISSSLNFDLSTSKVLYFKASLQIFASSFKLIIQPDTFILQLQSGYRLNILLMTLGEVRYLQEHIHRRLQFLGHLEFDFAVRSYLTAFYGTCYRIGTESHLHRLSA